MRLNISNVFDRSLTCLVRCETQAEEYILKMQNNTYVQGIDNGLSCFGVVPVKQAVYDENVSGSIKDILRDDSTEIYFVDHIPAYSFVPYYGKKN